MSINDDSEWEPWITHDGSGCPCVGKYCQFELDEDTPYEVGNIDEHGMKLVTKRVAEGFVKHSGGGWTHKIGKFWIVAYRIRKPKGLVILEKLLQDLPTKVDQGIDA